MDRLHYTKQTFEKEFQNIVGVLRSEEISFDEDFNNNITTN